MNRSQPILSALVVLAASSGCSAGQRALPTAYSSHESASMVRALATPEATTIFVSDGFADEVKMYSASGSLIGEITGIPGAGSEAVDGAGNLFVSSFSSYQVYEYAKPYTGSPTVLSDSDGEPFLIAVETKPGPVAGEFAIVSDSTTEGYDNVSIYRRGASHPCRTIALQKFSPRGSIFGASFDASGNLYFAGYQPYTDSAPYVGVLAGGCDARALTILKGANQAPEIGSIVIAPNGDVVLVNQSDPSTLIAFNPPVGNSLGSPISTTTIAGSQLAAQTVFSPSGAVTWTADFSLDDVIESDYPSGTEITSISTGILFLNDVAISPPAL
jgi:hypothetical protein